MLMPHSVPGPVSGAQDVRSALKLLTTVRGQIARGLMSAGQEVLKASLLSESWLLAALAAESFGEPSTRALSSALSGDFEPMEELVRSVERLTGLQLTRALPESTRRGRAPGDEPFPALVALVAEDDPFGLLSQALRAGRPVAVSTSFEPDAKRREDGAFYTPFPLARRLAERALRDLDAEPIPTVLDPACGAGTFLSASFDLLWQRLEARRKKHPDEIIEPIAWTVAALHGVEIDPTALTAARLAISVRAIRAERASGRIGQLALFAQSASYGPLIMDRLRLGDALGAAPESTIMGTERLRLRLLARDEPGRLPISPEPTTIVWDTSFPLRFSDDEGTYKEDGGFDLVLTNPPWVPVDRISAERREQLKRGLRTVQKRFDLFIGFVERARSVLAAGGRAALLLPRTFLSEANAERCRELLLETSSLTRIEELGLLKFDKARVDSVMLTFSARRPTETTAVEIARRGVKQPTAVLQSVFRRTPRAMFRMELAEPAAEECLRLAARSVPLGRYFCASWGARGSPVKDFHLDSPDNPLAKPMIKGDDVAPFRIRPPSRWLLYDVERLYRPARRELFEHEKIVVRKVTGGRGLVCAVDRDGHYTDDSLACVVRKGDLISIPLSARRKHRISIAPSQIEASRRYDLDFLCALLQAPVVQTYYRVQLGGGLNVFPELVESLPIPKPDQLDLPEVEELARLGRAARATGELDLIAADVLARKIFQLG
jgi:hypothetical protein